MKTYEVNIHSRHVITCEKENLPQEVSKLIQKIPVAEEDDVETESINEQAPDGSWIEIESMVCYHCLEDMPDGTGYTITEGEHEGETMCDDCYNNMLMG